VKPHTRSSRVGVCLVLFVTLAIAAGAQDKAQDKKNAQLKTVHGTVMDGKDNFQASAVVYLKNLKSQAIKTYIADEAGKYRFSGLDPNVDYEIHAEKGDMISGNRNISSFDSRKDLEMTLKVDKKRPGS
jgi:Carboxypeptidase regulatory-like domain